MGPFDLFGIIVESTLGVPAHLIAAYEQNTDLWNLVRPMMVALLVLGWSAKRTRRGAPSPAVQWALSCSYDREMHQVDVVQRFIEDRFPGAAVT